MPDEAHIIPRNVTARIVPKTLFGEKYVSLQVPKDPSSRSIGAGDVISESHVAIEVEKVLSDLYPLLRTVEPAQLNYTLTALADALEGRGEAVGQNLVTLDGYLKRMNPKIPLLVDDLGKLATVSDTYASVVPELANVLRNSVTTGHDVRGEGAEGPGVVRRRGGFLADEQGLLGDQRGQHHPVEQAGSGSAAVVREVRPGVPLPDQGPGQPAAAVVRSSSATTPCTSTSRCSRTCRPATRRPTARRTAPTTARTARSCRTRRTPSRTTPRSRRCTPSTTA